VAFALKTPASAHVRNNGISFFNIHDMRPGFTVPGVTVPGAENVCVYYCRTYYKAVCGEERLIQMSGGVCVYCYSTY
jgi:hypothetical protein